MASSSTEFTDDILIEIFTYLPLKSINKFKCLSKVWLSNLSNPDFITKWFKINYKSLPLIHYHTMLNQPPLRFRKPESPSPLRFRKAYPESHSEFMSKHEYLFNFEFLPLPGAEARLFLLGCSNGLVLCLSDSLDNETTALYHVCNPFTQKWVSLPPLHSASSLLHRHVICCEYSSTSSSSSSCSYKVVHIKKFDVDVFSSDLGVWQSFQLLCDLKDVWCSRATVVILSGVLYWIEGGERLLVCNISQNNNPSGGNRCSLVNLPDEEFGDHESSYDSFLGELEGRVCYARIRIKGNEPTVTAWVLDEVNNWKVLHKDISVENVLAQLSTRGEAEPIRVIQVLGFSPVDRNVVLFGRKHWVWVFNMQTRSVEELCLDSYDPYDTTMFFPFMLKPMPAVLPTPSWI